MTAQARKTDRRIERTHALLRDALMALIVEKGYDTITVQDIADKANVARTTFYLHFKDKDELLFHGMRLMYEELFQNAIAARVDDDPLGIGFRLDDSTDFEHVAKYADFYRIMISERGSISFLIRVQEFLANNLLYMILKPLEAKGMKSDIPLEIVAYSCAGAQIAVIKWWLDHDMPYTPKEMGKMLQDLSLKGLLHMLP
jgi:AcrR family transcriptional regulator